MNEDRKKTEAECDDEDADIIMREYDRIMDQITNSVRIQDSEMMHRYRELSEQIVQLAGKELLSEYDRVIYRLELKRSIMLFRRAMRLCFSFLFGFLPTRHDD